MRLFQIPTFWFQAEYIRVDETIHSGISVIFIDKDGNNSIMVVPGANFRLSEKDIDNAYEAMKNSAIVGFQLENELSVVSYGIKKAKESGASGIESISIPEMGGDLYRKEANALLPEMVLIPNFPSNLALSDEKAIFEFSEKLQNDAKGSPLMLQVSEDIPPHSWKRVLPALVNAIK